MHAESLNDFEKLISQKKTILKLESETFESLRDEHASLVSEKFVNPSNESPKKNSPKYDSSWTDFASCETCPSLHEEIKSLNKKLEQEYKGSMTYSMSSKDDRASFKRPYTKYLVCEKK